MPEGWQNGIPRIASLPGVVPPLLYRYASARQKKDQPWDASSTATVRRFDIDDRLLAHLRIVIMNKLRRNEGFMLQVPVNEGVRQASLWIHASNALVLAVLRRTRTGDRP